MSYGRNRVAADSVFSFSPSDYSYSGQLRFSASFPIFNQWQRESSIVAADVTAMIADATLRDTKFAAQQSLVQYLGALQTAQEQIRIQLVSVAAAEEDLRVQQQRYQLGAGTILDALTSQTTLNQARFLLIQARFNYRVAKAQLEALIGREL
jgi:outer membrane protein